MTTVCKLALTWTALLGAVGGQLFAQATRTWVSGVGDDANPCSRTAPCKTFAGAISKTAAGGEIDALDPGGFGTLTITKAVTIDGGGGQVASIVASGTNGIVISAGASDWVVLRNIQINGAGTTAGSDTRGIKFLSGARLVVEHCDISNMAKRGISIESSTNGAVATIIDSTIHDNLNNGIVINPPASTTNRLVLESVRSVNNLAYGLGANVGSIVQVGHSTLSNNSGGGLFVDNATVDVSASIISGNGTGIISQDLGIVRIGSSAITGNPTTLSIFTNGVIQSYGDNYFAALGGGVTSISKQ